jgi:hypothetical protein
MLIERLKFWNVLHTLFEKETFQDCCIHLLLQELFLCLKICLEPLKMFTFLIDMVHQSVMPKNTQRCVWPIKIVPQSMKPRAALRLTTSWYWIITTMMWVAAEAMRCRRTCRYHSIWKYLCCNTLWLIWIRMIFRLKTTSLEMCHKRIDVIATSATAAFTWFNVLIPSS